MDGDHITSLGKLCHCFTALLEKKCLLLSELTVLWHHLRPSPLVIVGRKQGSPRWEDHPVLCARKEAFQLHIFKQRWHFHCTGDWSTGWHLGSCSYLSIWACSLSSSDQSRALCFVIRTRAGPACSCILTISLRKDLGCIFKRILTTKWENQLHTYTHIAVWAPLLRYLLLPISHSLSGITHGWHFWCNKATDNSWNEIRAFLLGHVISPLSICLSLGSTC